MDGTHFPEFPPEKPSKPLWLLMAEDVAKLAVLVAFAWIIVTIAP